MKSSPLLWTLIAASLLILLLWFLSSRFPGVLSSPDAHYHILYITLLLMVWSGGMYHHYHGRMGEAARHAALWLLIGLASVTLYIFRAPMQDMWMHLRGELVPGAPVLTSEGALELTRSQDGHFYLEVEINGLPLRMLVDTGASNIAIDTLTARRLGIATENLDYSAIAQTANGQVHFAPVMLEEITAGPIVLHSVMAGIQREPLDTPPLLGMSFLEKLSFYSVTGEKLVLRP